MKLISLICISFFISFLPFYTAAQKIERFEHLNTADGLSQNSVLSIFCDSKGYMWFGTMNGLNRYDGNEFQVYKVRKGEENTLTHNRIIQIWEDAQKMIWIKTYDGYIHYFVPETEEFITFPYYTNNFLNELSLISCFEQAGDDEIWLGTTNSGIYHLKFDPETKRYGVRELKNYGQKGISHNAISFVLAKPGHDTWIGTENGLNRLQEDAPLDSTTAPDRYFLSEKFTCATWLGSTIYFGSAKNGLKSFSPKKELFGNLPQQPPSLRNAKITLLQTTPDHKLLIGTHLKGLFIFDPATETYEHYLNGFGITKIYQDKGNNLWVNTDEFGISRIDPGLKTLKKYKFTASDASLLDDERQFLYEDSKNNIWIGLHGSLAFYNKEKDEFELYKNDPGDPSSISSNIVYCITEDKSGLLWLGTGQPHGGVDKIITANPFVQQLVPRSNVKDYSENVVRGLFRDSNHYIWATTKTGCLYLLAPTDTLFNNPTLFSRKIKLEHNVYSIMEDKDGYIWMGTKGGGVYVSKESVRKNKDIYQHLSFYRYYHSPSDSASLSSDIVYSIHQDHLGHVWIGTYGGGLNLVTKRTADKLYTKKLNPENSNISSNEVRHVYEDSQNRLWVLTTFGLNLLSPENRKNFNFQTFLYNPDDPSSISYNDVIHVLEDSQKRLWFTTFGGGANLLQGIHKGKAIFKRFNQNHGLLNDAVFCALEDKKGNIWFSTEKGLSRLNISNNTFDNFDRNSGLPIENFNENTGIITTDHHLMFGNIGGILLVSPEKLTKSSFAPPIVLTNFQIFNKDVDYRQPDAPIQQHIETVDRIELAHYQSSFSIEYAALSYFASSQNNYAFKLENFDDAWNEVGNQRKATYTNLRPGKYLFKVKAASWDGTWNEEGRTLEIIISPPWWSTPLAKFIYFLLAIIIVEIIRRSYTRYHRLQNDLIVEKRISEIKLRFFTNISHEIRTPLTLILGPIEDIKAIPDVPQEVNSKLLIMEKNGKRLLRLVNQLLDFRKIQKNKMKLSVHEVELNAFLEDILLNFKQLAAHKNIELVYRADNEQLPVWIDGKLFDSVVFNILSNAFKFTPNGKKIQLLVTSSSEKYVDISIQDDGKGIPKDKMHLLFQRYTNLSTPDEKMNSSGIGLSLAYEIMKLHKGEILVESAEGHGARFTIRILKGNRHFRNKKTEISATARQEIQHEEVLPESKSIYWLDTDSDHEPANAKNKFKILIVEDNPEIVGYLTGILGSEYILRAAENGRRGLELIGSYQPDLLITDVMMPEMDGIEFTRRVKEAVESSHLPVIMLTAKSSVDDQVSGIESGADAYLLKPFNAQLLKATIKNLIQQRRSILDKYLKKDLPKTATPKKDIEIGEISITSKDEQFLENLIKYVEEHYNNPDFNVEKLADSSNVSRTVFYNKIKGLTGHSPSEFLRQIRLKIAAKLLLESDYNISEVAYRTGFNNVKYFRSHFKNMYGLNPSEFKEKHTALENASEGVSEN